MNGLWDENAGHDWLHKRRRVQADETTTSMRKVKVKFRATEQFNFTSTNAGYKTDISSAVLYVNKMKDQLRGMPCSSKRPQKEQRVFYNKTSGL